MNDKARTELEDWWDAHYGDDPIDWIMSWAKRHFGREKVTRSDIEQAIYDAFENLPNLRQSMSLEVCMHTAIRNVDELINGPEREWCSHYTWDCSLKKWVHLSEEWSHIASDADRFCRYCGKPRPGGEECT